MGQLEDVDGELVEQCDPATVPARDGCVVAAEPLAGLLLPFIDNWMRDRPSARYFGKNRADHDEIPTMSATGWLEQETGVPATTIQKLTQRDKTGEPHPSTQTVDLRVADALVTAIGRPEVFHDGTLEVRARKGASAATRAACCGRSTRPS